jgi:DNA-binding transcriptional regulator GbsR (MarR family)
MIKNLENLSVDELIELIPTLGLEKVLKLLLLHGLEGCRKSVGGIKLALVIATRERPVLFAHKTYSLMMEHRDKMINEFGVKEEEICICGTSKHYDEALRAYTNPDKPRFMPWKAKYIYCTQAVLQRNKHKSFYSWKNLKKGFSAIIVDEFDFKIGIIPALHYQLSRFSEEVKKDSSEEDLQQWIKLNYTQNDCEKIVYPKYEKDIYKKFYVADWLDNADCPVIFLTSETLAAKFLKLLGFACLYIPSKNYKNCVIKTYATKNIVKEFYEVMNDNHYWSNFTGFTDLIISDSADVVLETSLNIVSHTGARGSNQWIGKKVLTILSHVPHTVIEKITDTFNCFGANVTVEEIYQAYYRDRLCQAVGRVIGNRGGTETMLIIHERILKSLLEMEDFPYTFEILDELPPELNFCKIMKETYEKIKEKKVRINNYKKEERKIKTEKTLEELRNVLQVDETSELSQKELAKVLLEKGFVSASGTKNIPIEKVMKFFNVTKKQRRVNGKREYFVVGLGLKQKEA